MGKGAGDGAPPGSGFIFWLRTYAFGSHRQIPSLDGIRALSAAFVILAHLCGTARFPLSAQSSVANLGIFGVRIFFVISGYLITSILLTEQERTGTINLSRFYFRRTLRLFPASWAFITVAAILGSYGLLKLSRYDLLFAYSYTSNYYEGRSFAIGHLWSLAVEEQFYLLWPATLVLMGPKRGKQFLMGLLCLAPVFRLLSPFLGAAMNFLTSSDILATGCLLSLWQKELRDNRHYRALLASPLMPLLPFIALAANYTPSTKVRWLVGETVMNVCIAVCIDWAVKNPRRGAAKLLNLPAVATMGVLSYSLYLWQQLFSEFGFTSWLGGFPQNLVFIVCAALGSYILIEGPFLHLRGRLERSQLRSSTTTDGLVRRAD